MLSTISRAIFRVYSNMWVLVTTYKLSSQRVLMTRVNENGMMNRYGKRNFIHGAAEDPNNFHCIGISSCMHDYRAISLKTPHKEQRSLRRKFLPPSSSASDVGCSGGLSHQLLSAPSSERCIGLQEQVIDWDSAQLSP